jgi:thiol-disulfide isomerase/thioredoxin
LRLAGAPAALALLLLSVDHGAAAPVKEGQTAPLAALAGVIDADGRAADLWRMVSAPQPRGSSPARRATLLVFWASWCAPCIHEIPVLNELRRFYGERGLRVVGLGIREGGETLASLKEAAAKNGATYPVFYDSEGRAQEAFEVHTLPMSALIDAEGTVRWIGPALPADVAARVEAALAPGEPRGAK